MIGNPSIGSSLLIGSRNQDKVHEIRTILGDLPLELCSLEEFPSVGIAEEKAFSYSGNAIAKARYYAQAANLLTLADDSGLEVEALGGRPGVLSARYAGVQASDEDRRSLLLEELSNAQADSRKARFVCAVAIADTELNVIHVVEGTCEGTICGQPRGRGGFGYDPLFIPDGYDLTFAELPESVKNQLSHRARALVSTREFIVRTLVVGL